MPSKTPEYRAARDHSDFLTTMQANLPDRTTPDHFYTAIRAQLGHTFEVTVTDTAHMQEELQSQRYASFAVRSSIELPDKYLADASRTPSLVRLGPSCHSL